MTVADGAPLPPEPPSSGTRPGLLPLLLLALLLAAAGVGVYLLLGPHLDFTNALAGPVKLAVGGDRPSTVPPGGSMRVRLARGRTAVVQWELVRPLSADGRPMGEEVRGSSVLRAPAGTVHVATASRTTDDAYFAPLITNASTRALRIVVNAGLRGAVDCGCAVRPGARRVFIGYYHLFQNSTVEARASGFDAATFRELGPRVTAPDGTVGLRFEDKDLRGGG
jgi:hypothetical protein